MAWSIQGESRWITPWVQGEDQMLFLGAMTKVGGRMVTSDNGNVGTPFTISIKCGVINDSILGLTNLWWVLQPMSNWFLLRFGITSLCSILFKASKATWGAIHLHIQECAISMPPSSLDCVFFVNLLDVDRAYGSISNSLECLAQYPGPGRLAFLWHFLQFFPFPMVLERRHPPPMDWTEFGTPCSVSYSCPQRCIKRGLGTPWGSTQTADHSDL